MRRVALAAATVPSARIALARCDNATELSEFYSFCDIVRQPLRRQKRMTIFAICLHNDCKREENGDARIPLCVPKTSFALISRKNRLTSAHHDRAAVFRNGRLGRAIQVEEPA